MSFAIFYGSDSSVEQSIMVRLRHITSEAMHPLLLPGMFAELELERHKGLVEASINEVEAKIIELDITAGDKQNYDKGEVEKKNELKRTAWLGMTYLRNSITTWKVQVERMSEHVDELIRDEIVHEGRETSLATSQTMSEVDLKIKTRLVAICDEYDKKIRDCTMRVDGMAMATQWVLEQGSTFLSMSNTDPTRRTARRRLR